MLAFSETARMMTSAVQQAVKLVLALGIGAAGGAVFQYFHLPLAWMVGAMLATTFGSVAGIRMQVPKRLHNAMLAIIGVLLGCTFTPDVLGMAAHWIPSITVVLVSQVFMGALVITLCYRFARYDMATSYFVGVPGALNQVTAMAPEMGADVRKVSLSHAIRVLVIIMAISLLSTFLMDGSTLPATATKHVTPPGTARLDASRRLCSHRPRFCLIVAVAEPCPVRSDHPVGAVSHHQQHGGFAAGIADQYGSAGGGRRHRHAFRGRILA
jgi:membrane AbrB-like protein